MEHANHMEAQLKARIRKILNSRNIMHLYRVCGGTPAGRRYQIKQIMNSRGVLTATATREHQKGLAIALYINGAVPPPDLKLIGWNEIEALTQFYDYKWATIIDLDDPASKRYS